MSVLSSLGPVRARLLAASVLTVSVAAVVVLGGCGSDPLTTMPAASATAESRSQQAQLDQSLKALRQATAKYHSFAQAQQDGYTFLFMDMCMVDPNLGGMGYHYVNTSLLGGAPDLIKPEALLYEPAPNGSLKLVAVEYAIPADAWTDPVPPTLMGQQFTLNSFNLWALHVWLYKENPSGMFAGWNPTVSCDNATAAARTAP